MLGSMTMALRLLCGCAPSGYKYDTGSFVARPIDACARLEITTGLVNLLNTRIAQRDGPPDRVVSI